MTYNFKIGDIVEFIDSFPHNGKFQIVGSKEISYKPKSHPYNSIILPEENKEFVIVSIDNKSPEARPINGLHVSCNEIELS